MPCKRLCKSREERDATTRRRDAAATRGRVEFESDCECECDAGDEREVARYGEEYDESRRTRRDVPVARVLSSR